MTNRTEVIWLTGRFSGPMCCCDVCRGLPWPQSVYGLVPEPNPHQPGTAEYEARRRMLETGNA
jgi:hypothetical protein